MTLIYPFQKKKFSLTSKRHFFIYTLFQRRKNIFLLWNSPFSIIFRPYLKSKVIRNILDDPHISFSKKKKFSLTSKRHFFIYTLFQRRKNIYFLWNSPFSIIFRPYLHSKVIRNILDDPHISFSKKNKFSQTSKRHIFIYTLLQRRKNIFFLWNSPFSIILRP